MSVRVIVGLELVHIDHQNREGAAVTLAPVCLLLEHLHRPPPIVDAGEPVGDREPLELLPSLPKPPNHVIEDHGQIAHLTTTRDRKVDGEISSRYLGGAIGQPVEWPHDEQREQIRDEPDSEQQGGDRQQGQVPEPSGLRAGLGRGNLGDDGPTQAGHIPRGSDHLQLPVADVLGRRRRAPA